MNLLNKPVLYVKQVFEAFELFGFETRNKYKVFDENQNVVAYAAEQGKSIFAFIFRQVLGHWRSFKIEFRDDHERVFMTAHHPFRFYFERLEIYDLNNTFVGALEKRFSILSKKFDMQDSRGVAVMEMRSPIWKIWTFPFFRNGQEQARVEKKWTGILAEAFTDKDTFAVKMENPSLQKNEKLILLAASVFIDIRYFERKAD